VLDARKCIAYLTIELRSAIEEHLRESVGSHLFGCDDCQTVCPFNASARPRDSASTRAFAPHARWHETELVDLLALDEKRWKSLSEGSPLHRATPDGLARNAAIVLGNEPDGVGSEVAQALDVAAREHPSPVVRDAARWASERLHRRAAAERARNQT
jgi:epoxyqueuosine reductase